MSKRFSNITDGELFADLQQSAADIILLEMLKGLRTEKQSNRLQQEREILEVIKTEIKDRFHVHQINDFLEYGYPRRINLNRR